MYKIIRRIMEKNIWEFFLIGVIGVFFFFFLVFGVDLVFLFKVIFDCVDWG